MSIVDIHLATILAQKVLSNYTINMKYAKYLPNLKRRETWEELCIRNMNMHLDKYPNMTIDILNIYNNFVIPKKILPSMRSLQFSGKPINLNPSRIFNCAYAPVDTYYTFSETMFLLLGGTGVGYSVQKRHIKKLPRIIKPMGKFRYLIQDSIIGLSDAVKVLMKAYFEGGARPIFDYSDIRPKGSLLKTTGGKAPGFQALKTALDNIEKILTSKRNGSRLTSLEIHDIQCFIAESVLSGGIRRSAMICFFDINDIDMLNCKAKNWWEFNPQRAMANNSAVVVRHKVKREDFDILWERVRSSGSGEPGILFTHNPDVLSNPCVSGDTEILTDDGYKRIDSLVNKEVNVWNGFEYSKVTPTITGRDQNMLKITFNDGRELTCTEYHNFHIIEGYIGKTLKVKANELNVGDKLIKHNFPIIEHGEILVDAYTQGFISAEGMEENKTVNVYLPKQMCISRLENVSRVVYEEGNKRFRVLLKNKPISKNLVPISYNLKSKLEWLSGLFDGDGCELKEGGLQLISVNREFLKNLQTLLSTLGVQAKVVPFMDEGMRMLPDGRGGSKEFLCKEACRICVGAVQMQELKRLGLNCERLKFDKTPQRDASQFVSVKSITKAGKEEVVYCFTEPKRNLGIFNGIITGQCAEIALKPFQFCNLVEINASDISTQEELEARVKAATTLSTLQAGYTDFHYLRPIWKETTEEDALLGVSMTGIASGGVLKLDLPKVAKMAVELNKEVSTKIGINSSQRVTTVKPAGTTSLVLGSSSGVHAWHSPFFIRRIRLNKSESVYKYILSVNPEILEDCVHSPDKTAIFCIPVKAPEGSIFRDEDSLDLLERVKKLHNEWIKPGHVGGDNSHNVSTTVSIKNDEWDKVRDWMWDNKQYYNGISVLPYNGGTYLQAPFEEITEEEFNKRVILVKDIDFSQIIEEDDVTDLTGELACGASGCEIK